MRLDSGLISLPPGFWYVLSMNSLMCRPLICTVRRWWVSTGPPSKSSACVLNCKAQERPSARFIIVFYLHIALYKIIMLPAMKLQVFLLVAPPHQNFEAKTPKLTKPHVQLVKNAHHMVHFTLFDLHMKKCHDSPTYQWWITNLLNYEIGF